MGPARWTERRDRGHGPESPRVHVGRRPGAGGRGCGHLRQGDRGGQGSGQGHHGKRRFHERSPILSGSRPIESNNIRAGGVAPAQSKTLGRPGIKPAGCRFGGVPRRHAGRTLAKMSGLPRSIAQWAWKSSGSVPAGGAGSCSQGASVGDPGALCCGEVGPPGADGGRDEQVEAVGLAWPEIRSDAGGPSEDRLGRHGASLRVEATD